MHGTTEKEIRSRIGKAQVTFKEMRNQFDRQKFNIQLRLRTWKCYFLTVDKFYPLNLEFSESPSPPPFAAGKLGIFLSIGVAEDP